MFTGKILKNILIVLFISLISLLTGCFDDRHYISDKTFIEISREYSPDNKKIILTYQFDQGAFGLSTGYTAVLSTNKLNADLRPFNLPDKYNNAKWIDENSIEVEINTISDIRENKQSIYESIEINGVRINPILKDVPKHGTLKIESRKSSPNGTKELIAYRYTTDEKRGFLNISIIKKGEEIPKFGNYFIGKDSSDYVFNAKWLADDEVQFESNSTYEKVAKHYFVKNRPLTNFSIIINDAKHKSKYLWDSDKPKF